MVFPESQAKLKDESKEMERVDASGRPVPRILLQACPPKHGVRNEEEILVHQVCCKCFISPHCEIYH